MVLIFVVYNSVCVAAVGSSVLNNHLHYAVAVSLTDECNYYDDANSVRIKLRCESSSSNALYGIPACHGDSILFVAAQRGLGGPQELVMFSTSGAKRGGMGFNELLCGTDACLWVVFSGWSYRRTVLK